MECGSESELCDWTSVKQQTAHKSLERKIEKNRKEPKIKWSEKGGIKTEKVNTPHLRLFDPKMILMCDWTLILKKKKKIEVMAVKSQIQKCPV